MFSIFCKHLQLEFNILTIDFTHLNIKFDLLISVVCPDVIVETTLYIIFMKIIII